MTPVELCNALVSRRDIGEETSDAFYALLRRDWAVRVLDAWADGNPGRCYRVQRVVCADAVSPAPECSNVWVATPFLTQRMNTAMGFGPTPDIARHAAAIALFPRLPADKRAGLGECP